MMVYAIGSCDETILWIDTSKDLGYLKKEVAEHYLEAYRVLVRKMSSFAKGLQ